MKRVFFLLAVLLSATIAGRPAAAQVNKAEDALEKQNYDEALQYVDVALREKPDDAKAHELRGRIYLSKASAAEDSAGYLELLSQMVQSFERAATLDPDMATGIQNRLDFAYATEFQRGIQAYTEAESANNPAKFVQSSRHFQACTIIAPDSTGSFINWAFALMAAGHEAEAIEPLERVAAMSGQDEEIVSHLSRLYLTNDRAADAVPLLEEATQAFPANEELRDNLLNAYMLTGQTDRAIQTYERLIATNGDNKTYRYNYGSLLLQAGMYEQAVEQLKVAVDLDAQDAYAQFNLGAAYVNQAFGANESVDALNEDLLVNRSSFTADELQTKQAELEELKAKRDELFALAIVPLENARSLLEAAGENVTDVCRALFRSYAQTGDAAKAESVQACAGM